MRKLLAALGLIAAVWLPSGAENCQLVRVVSFDMLPSSMNVVVVQNFIGEHPVRMVVDTGGYVTALTEAKAQELGLPIVSRPTSTLSIFGGLRLTRFATFNDFRIGPFRAVTLSYPLVPNGFLPDDIDGLLAPDLLANYDLDFDFGARKLSLFLRDHCPGKVGYWTRNIPSAIPIVRDEEGVHISTRVQLDGKEIKALIDTGARRSVMSLETAQRRYDIADDDPRFVSARGPNGTTGARRFPFHLMSFGGVVVDNPDITLVPDSEARMGGSIPDLVLGFSILKHLHLYIAYGERMMYVTDANDRR
jgi:predicted aspartyl protease